MQMKHAKKKKTNSIGKLIKASQKHQWWKKENDFFHGNNLRKTDFSYKI